jgi:hypothetical protein
MSVSVPAAAPQRTGQPSMAALLIGAVAFLTTRMVTACDDTLK